MNELGNRIIFRSSVVSISKSLAPTSLYHENDTAAIRISTLLSYGTKLPSTSQNR